MEDPGLAEAEGGAVVAGVGAAAAGFDPDQPDAFDPPPTQATARSGSRPSASRNWARASSPMTRWNSLTMSG